jgi:hypothetical protein
MTSAAPTVCDPYYIVPTAQGTIVAEHRRAMVEEAAYYRAQRRGFAPGHELEDWVLAEREIDAAVAPGAKRR